MVVKMKQYLQKKDQWRQENGRVPREYKITKNWVEKT